MPGTASTGRGPTSESGRALRRPSCRFMSSRTRDVGYVHGPEVDRERPLQRLHADRSHVAAIVPVEMATSPRRSRSARTPEWVAQGRTRAGRRAQNDGSWGASCGGRTLRLSRAVPASRNKREPASAQRRRPRVAKEASTNHPRGQQSGASPASGDRRHALRFRSWPTSSCTTLCRRA